jgi:4-hydroxy-4-methyl-2-oxoglutarate aldolase
MDETTLFTTIREKLSTSLIGDVLDVAGLLHQFLPPGIRALHPDMVLVGRAMPVLEADCFGDTVASRQQREPFGLMLRALDSLRPGDVYIATGASPRYALWGGLMSTRAKSLGAAGAVLDGFHRDTREILPLGFPVFSTGAYAQDQRMRGRVIDVNCPIEFANAARVEPGDIVVGDIDGVVIIPKAHAQAIVADALAKLHAEETVRDMIGRGQSTQSIFDETGVM